MQKQFKRVILVDDDDISNYLTGSTIKSLDITDEIVILKNGKQALDYITENCCSETVRTPDLLLLDINMAVVNGFELLEALHYTNYLENLKIVMLTTSQNPKDIDAAAQYRIYGYLTKPLDIEKFKEILDVISSSHLKFSV